VGAVFDTYWEHPDFQPYDPAEFERQLGAGTTGPTIYLSPVAVTAYPFQERMLEQLEVSRRQGHHRNLLASATGTGKTVMAALDYARLRDVLARDRLLFVAHRQEILNQSQATFRHVLRDPGFGEQWIAGRRPHRFDHVFASIQSLNVADLTHLDPTHFDVVIVDEFHHAAAPSYARLLRHVRPVEMLGLTATPERSDGVPVLHWFGDRIAAELRLWDAIDQHHLSPFAYYGIHDGLDLREIPWRRGRGYDVEGLTRLYTANDVWARQVIKEVGDRIDNLDDFRALGFCVSVEHAQYMARVFNEAGLPTVAIWGDTSDSERQAALNALRDGRVRVVFSVDLFNEGLDAPSVDTLLMLRPTESPTLFMQQLGRGLRRERGKTVCTVLDFVGHHRRELRFDRTLRALLGGSRKDLEAQVEAGFPYLPAGCHMELDHVVSDIVLRSIRSAIPSRWPERVAELQSQLAAGHPATLVSFIEESGLDLDDVYSGNRSWSDLLEGAGVYVASPGPQEGPLRRALGRLLHVDDQERIAAYREVLTAEQPPTSENQTERHRRLTRMLIAQLVDSVPRNVLPKGADLEAALDLLWQHPQVRAEAIELLNALESGIDHVHTPLDRRTDVPLNIHGRYTRLEILAAFGRGDGARAMAWQTGVLWLPEQRADLLAFTLDKTEGSFSPTTRYRDYAISRELIHWESQSATRADSDTGRRYQEHAQQGSDVFLFARLRQRDRAFWFLGPATYAKHEGERPMAITWRLAHPLPGDLFAQFAAAVA
jgi:superfamily II DNA or RNA helicase